MNLCPNIDTAILVVILATISNTVVKVMITVVKANREVKRQVLYAMGVMLGVAILFALSKL